MKTNAVLLVLVVFISFIYADDLYFKDGRVWYNCQITGIELENVKLSKIDEKGLQKSFNMTMSLFEGVIKKDINKNKATSEGFVSNNEIAKFHESGELIPVNKYWMTTYMSSNEITMIIDNKKPDMEPVYTPKKKNSKINKPLFFTGTALSVLGVDYLIQGISTHIVYRENYVQLTQDQIDTYKFARNRQLFFGGLFTLAGIVDIYWSFDKFQIGVNKNGYGLTYSF